MKRVLVISPSAITQAGLSALIAEESDIGAETDSEAIAVSEIPQAIPDVRRWQVVGTATQPISEDWASTPADCLLVSWAQLGDGLLDLDRFNDRSIPVVALLDTWSDVALPDLLHNGLAGLLPIHASGAEIVAALDAAVAGLVVVHPMLLDNLLTLNGSLQATAPQTEALTPREVEVLALLAEGLSNKAIARRLHLSEHTIKYHTSAIFAKLNVSSRTEAAIAGARAGLILL